MSDRRKADETYLKRIGRDLMGVNKRGSFSMKVEVFYAYHWAGSWNPPSSLFYPRPPLRTEDRQRYWENMYRLRIDGKWFGIKAKFNMFTRIEIGELLVAIDPVYVEAHTLPEDENDY